jgi:hypothetical protein
MAARIVGDHHMSPQLPRSGIRRAHCFVTLGAIGGYRVQILGTDAHAALTRSRFGHGLFAVSQQRLQSAVALFARSAQNCTKSLPYGTTARRSPSSGGLDGYDRPGLACAA